MNGHDERRPRSWRHGRQRDEGRREEGYGFAQGNDSGRTAGEGEHHPYGQREPYNARGGAERARWGGPWNEEGSRYSESQYGMRRSRFEPYGDRYEPRFGEGPFADTSEAPGYFGSGNPPREEPRRYRAGPKGYTRSDERIREDICERLMLADSIDPSEVSVSVKEGRVALEGTVPTRRMKHAIEDLADYTAGVTDVDNRIQVERPVSAPASNVQSTSSPKATKQ